MSNLLVSIIIPCYRQAHWLATAIDAALGQSYHPVEVIVVNDGSDDNTDEVAAQYAGSIHYIKQANAGLSAARNAGLHAATGRLVMFLDSDDSLHPDAIAWLAGAIGDRQDCVAVMGSELFAVTPGDMAGTAKFPSSGVNIAEDLLLHNVAIVHGILAPRQAVCAAGGFELSLCSCEDWDLWSRLAFRGNDFQSVNRAGAYYRRYAGSMSTDELRMTTMTYEVLSRILHRLKRSSQTQWPSGQSSRDKISAVRAKLATESFDAAYRCRQEGRRAESALWLIRSMRFGCCLRAFGALLKLAAFPMNAQNKRPLLPNT